MRKVLPFLIVGLLILAALIGSLNYSSDTAIYECSGVMTVPNNSSGPTTLFAEITQYRWWAFWNPFDGLLLWKFKAHAFRLFPMILLPLDGLKLVLILRGLRRSSPDSDLAHRPRRMRERTFSASRGLSLISFCIVGLRLGKPPI